MIYAVCLPGFLLINMLKISLRSKTELMLLSIATSLSFLLFTGLFLNTMLPAVGIQTPLARDRLMFFYIPIIFVFSGFALFRNKIDLKFFVPRISWVSIFGFFVPLCLLFLGILGAHVMNTKGSNVVTLWCIGFCVLFVAFVSIYQRFRLFVYPWAIFCISAALLLLYSLRSNHIIGWDIHLEYLVFQLTDQNKQWLLSRLHNPYNSCLSITILPTIFSSLLNINPEYIYKVIFQLLFALTPVGIYTVIKRFVGYPIIAFLSAVVFIFQTWFMLQMTSLIRQQVAFFFFSLLLLILFHHELSKRQRWGLLLILGSGMIVSHYSTAYIWVGLLGLYGIARVVFQNVVKFRFHRESVVSIPVFCFFLIGTLTWNVLLTRTTQNVSGVIGDIRQEFGKIFSLEFYKQRLDQLLFRQIDFNDPRLIQEVYNKRSEDYRTLYDDLELYDPSTYREYVPYPVKSIKIPSFSPIIEAIANRMSQLVKILVVLLFPSIGLFILFLRRHNVSIIHDYVLFGFCMLVLIGLLLFLPGMQKAYNLTRLHLQSLFFLGLPTVLGGIVLFKHLKIRFPAFAVAFSLGVFFFFTSGAVYQFAGGEAFEHLNNFGNSFDKFYVFDGEVSAARWLREHYNGRDIIYADIVANARLYSFAMIHTAIYDVFPSTIDKNAYVFASGANILRGRAFASYDIDFISYAYPLDFLNNQKNILYANPYARIYK
ncbi:MAG: DUF2206 domain-containing protein [Patescibacteria group bacterium]|nr:DUF2206 domain-containing protein [Patescibacteria group bacterium]